MSSNDTKSISVVIFALFLASGMFLPEEVTATHCNKGVMRSGRPTRKPSKEIKKACKQYLQQDMVQDRMLKLINKARKKGDAKEVADRSADYQRAVNAQKAPRDVLEDSFCLPAKDHC